MIDDDFCIVLVTTNSRKSTDDIISMLLDARLAACIQTLPVSSHYRWEGKVCSDEEILLLIKTRTAHFDTIQHEIKSIHPYDTPQIIAVPVVDGQPDYLQWLSENVSPVNQ